MPTRWGKQGHVNLIGTPSFEKGAAKRLEYRLVEGPCRSWEFVGYLDTLADEAERASKPVVVVSANMSFHTAETVRDCTLGGRPRG